MSDRLTMRITYPMKDLRPRPSIKSNIKREHWDEVIGEYVRGQIGNGIDKTPAIDRDVYEITIQLDPTDDTYYVKHNCGNKGLRDGILMETLRQIAVRNVTEE